MKKIVALILVSALLLCVIPLGALTVSAETITLNGVTLNYTLDAVNGGITITDCDSSISGDVVIPSEIDGYPVVVIDDGAFLRCELMTSVTIPNTVKTIGVMAFYECKSLKTITIPSSLEYIDTNVFSSGALEAVYITDLEAWCNIDFANCYSNPLFYAHNLYINDVLATDIVIPDSITAIKKMHFIIALRLNLLQFPIRLQVSAQTHSEVAAV